MLKEMQNKRFIKKLEKIGTLRVEDYSDFYNSLDVSFKTIDKIAMQVCNLCNKFRLGFKTTYCEENTLYMTIYLK